MHDIAVWRGKHGDPVPLHGPLPGVRNGDVLAYEFELPANFVPRASRVDLVHVTDDGDSVTVRDLYIDVMVPTDGRHQRLLDLDEYADAIEAGELDAATAVDGLRRWQRFLDRHLHDTRDPRHGWADFPPGRVLDLAALLSA